jgi:hypothetical protein
MRDVGVERGWGDALLDAMIPAPGGDLPPLAVIDREHFWQRFAAAAPLELRIAWRCATVALVVVAPFLLGYRTIFTRLAPSARDDVLRRAGSLPGGDALVLIVKLLACFAYFDDAGVQRIARAAAAP